MTSLRRDWCEKTRGWSIEDKMTTNRLEWPLIHQCHLSEWQFSDSSASLPYFHSRKIIVTIIVNLKFNQKLQLIFWDISGLPGSFSVLVQFWGRTWRGSPQSHLKPLPSPPLPWDGMGWDIPPSPPLPSLSLFQPQPVSCLSDRNKLQTPSLTCSFRSHSHKTRLTAFRLLGHFCFVHFSEAWAASKLKTNDCHACYPLYSPELKTIFFSICFVLADIQNTQLSHLRCPSITPRSRSQESECQRFHRKNIFIFKLQTPFAKQ